MGKINKDINKISFSEGETDDKQTDNLLTDENYSIRIHDFFNCFAFNFKLGLYLYMKYNNLLKIFKKFKSF